MLYDWVRCSKTFGFVRCTITRQQNWPVLLLQNQVIMEGAFE
jgi:hypothetical protein